MHNKAQNIINLSNEVTGLFGKQDIRTVDHWDEDPNAIGFVGPLDGYLIYVSMMSDDDNSFYVSLEYPPNDDSMPYEPGDDYDNIKKDQLFEIIKSHLLERKTLK